MTKRAILCDHFAFGSAAGGRGSNRYGIMARSAGVDSRTLRLLDGYLHPAGIDPAAFTRSSSLLVLGGTVAFTQAKNAGHDAEGRPNSIYSHTVLIGERDFAAIGNDTRVLAMQTPRVDQAGDLRPLEIRPLEVGMDLASARRLGLAHLRPFLEAVFSGRRVAIRRTSNTGLLPGLLSLLPPQLRLVPFATLLPDPPRQPSFEIVQTDAPRSSLGRYRVIDSAGGRPRAATSLLGRCAGHLARLISEGDERGIARIHGEFAAIPELNRRDRLCVVAGAAMYDAGLLRSEAYAERLAQMLDPVPAGRAAAYFGRLEQFLAAEDRARHAQRYGAHLLALRHADRPLDAASFSEMLDRCGDAGPGALVRALLEQRPDDLRAAGAAVLASAAFRPDAQDVVDAFAAAPALRPAILCALSEPTAQDAGRRRRLFAMAARPLLLLAGPEHLAGLLAAGAHDLADDEDARLFRDAVSSLFSDPAVGNAGLGPLAGAAEAVYGEVSPHLSRPGGVGEGQWWHYRHLLGALADARDALDRAAGRERPSGPEDDGQARKRAALVKKKIESLIDEARAAPRYEPPPLSASAAPWFWQWWLPAQASSSVAK